MTMTGTPHGEMVDLAEAMADVAGRVDVEEILRLAVDRSAPFMSAEHVMVSFHTEDGFLVAEGPPGTAVRRVFEEVEMAGDSRFPAELRLPLASGGRVVGAISWARSGRSFDEEEYARARVIAHPLAAALEAARLFEAEAESAERLQALLASTEALWRPRPVGEIVRSAVEQAVRLLPGVQCLVSLVPRERPDNFAAAAGAGPWAEAVTGREWPQAGSVAGRAMAERRVIETTHLMSQSALKSVLQEAGASGIETARLVPLTTGEPLPDGRTAMGVIGFYRAEPRPFSPRQRQLMDEFGKRFSLVLHRAELLESANRTNRLLRTTIDATLELASSLDHREIIARLLERALEDGDADRAVLCRVEGEVAIVEAGRDRTRRHVNVGAVYGAGPGSVTAQAVETRRPVVTDRPDVKRSGRRAELAVGDLRWIAVLPLAGSERPDAVLMLVRRQDRPFQPEELEQLQQIGNAAGVALRNARTYGQAYELGRAKSDFMNLAAHELRTPLSVINGYVSMLEDGSFGPLPELVARPVGVIASKTGELNRLVEDLLISSRLEAGTMPSVSDRFDLRTAARAAVERCEPRAALLGADVELHLPAGPVPVIADIDHVARILDNLINNALTYTVSRPQVTVSVSAGPPPSISVIDNGVGIPEKERERVFERFYRLEHPQLPRQPGTGLGLAISRELAALSDATVVAEGAPGGGSLFRLELPPAS